MAARAGAAAMEKSGLPAPAQVHAPVPVRVLLSVGRVPATAPPVPVPKMSAAQTLRDL